MLLLGHAAVVVAIVTVAMVIVVRLRRDVISDGAAGEFVLVVVVPCLLL